MWLSLDVLEWKPFVGGSSTYTTNPWARAYEIWSHAQRHLSTTTEMSRVDAITTLRRAIDHRVRLLKEFYSFRNIPIRKKPSEIFSLLEFLGIVRPLMLQKLIAIRNAVEHEDVPPPDAETCQIFLEFVWYFLRSTDGIARTIVEDFLLHPLVDEKTDWDYWLNISMNPDGNWIPEINGWITPELVSDFEKEGWIVLKTKRTETRAELFARLKNDEDYDEGRGRNSDDIYIHGEVRGSNDILIRLHNIYWSLL